MYNTLLGKVVVSPLQGKLFRLIHYFLVFRCGVQLIRNDCPEANEINNLSPDGNGNDFLIYGKCHSLCMYNFD